VLVISIPVREDFCDPFDEATSFGTIMSVSSGSFGPQA
jgi:hypothetical protein